VTAVVGRGIFKGPSPTPEPSGKPTTISVADPKYISVDFETVTVDETGQSLKRDPKKQASSVRSIGQWQSL
jgi:hypothetical protein